MATSAPSTAGGCSRSQLGRPPSLERADLDLDEIADLEERGGRRASGPRKRRRRQLDVVLADPHAGASAGRSRHERHDGRHDVAGEDRLGPSLGGERLDRATLGDDVARRLPEAVPPLVDAAQTAIDRGIGRLLQLDVERRLHAEAGLIERVGAELLLELLANVFDEVGRNRPVRRGLPEEHERTCALPRRPPRA